MSLKALLEERSGVAAEMNELTALVRGEQDRPFNSEELQKFDRMEARFKELSDRIETTKRIERSAEIKAQQETPIVRTDYRGNNVVITRQDKDLAFKYWSLKAAGLESVASDKHIAAAEKCKVTVRGDRTSIPLHHRPQEITRAQSSQLTSEGGALQNDGVFQELERNMKYWGGARLVAKVIRSEDGSPKKFGYGDDTGNFGRFLGQNTTLTNTNVVYQSKYVGSYEYTTTVYPVSLALLQDAQVDVSADVGEVIGRRLGAGLNPYYTSGNAASLPSGFLTGATLGTTTASSPTAISYDDLRNLYFSMDRAYRTTDSKFTMSDTTLNALWGLVDGDSRPLFWNQLQNLTNENPLNLFGHEIVVNNDMDSPTASKKPIAFINQGGFIINDVQDVQIIVLKERYMDELAVGYIGFIRTDSKLINPNRCVFLAMHS